MARDMHRLTFLIIFLREGEIVIHVRRVGVVEEVGGQLALQEDRLVSELAHLDEKFLIAGNW